jgi:flagellar assembly protein FliH
MWTKPSGAESAPRSGSMAAKLLRAGAGKAIQPIRWQTTPGTAVDKAPEAGVAPSQAWIPRAQPDPALPAPPERIEPSQLDLLKRQLTEAEAGAEARVRAARESAFREGQAAGRNEAAAQVAPVLENLARSLDQIASLRPKLRTDAEADVLRLALAIARKVLHRELTIDGESLAGLVRVAVERIRLQDIIRVRVHPQHHVPVQQLLAKLSPHSCVELVPDPKLDLGGLVVETTRGEWNASVETQLKEIERGLTDRLLR